LDIFALLGWFAPAPFSLLHHDVERGALRDKGVITPADHEGFDEVDAAVERFPPHAWRMRLVEVAATSWFQVGFENRSESRQPLPLNPCSGRRLSETTPLMMRGAP
jgi:hypothetical protein